MIVLKEPGIIFLKSRKTAGSSLEIALSAFANRDDIVTPLDAGGKDDRRRQELGYAGPRNYRKSSVELLVKPTWRDWRGALKGKPLQKYHDHSSARRARFHLRAEDWCSFSKISIVRNPWDYMISSYYWANRNSEKHPDFQAWCLDNIRLLNRNYRQYFIGRDLVIDHFLRFETLGSDLLDLEKNFPALKGIAKIFSGINAKAGVRPESGPSLAQLYGDAKEVDRVIRERCRFEIERFGYEGPDLE
jgi:hypothetical protein